MCIIIDTNSWAEVFDATAEKHTEFEPVYVWIAGEHGIGKMVCGGATYRNEIPKKYLRIFKLFNDKRKTIMIADEVVDAKETELKAMLEHRDFDDPHIVALVCVSGCRLVCTQDDRAIPFITGKHKEAKQFYPKKFVRPKIYRSSKNANLLVEKNIPKQYLPPERNTKKQSKVLATVVQNATN
jgi:predicted nucleic acid-binding protein